MSKSCKKKKDSFQVSKLQEEIEDAMTDNHALANNSSYHKFLEISFSSHNTWTLANDFDP